MIQIDPEPLMTPRSKCKIEFERAVCHEKQICSQTFGFQAVFVARKLVSLGENFGVSAMHPGLMEQVKLPELLKIRYSSTAWGWGGIQIPPQHYDSC